MMVMSQTDLIGVKDAARLLEVSRATVHRWVDAGRLDAAGAIGGKNVLVFDRAAVEALAAKRGVTP
jgi:excisionase family DNA binding protein